MATAAISVTRDSRNRCARLGPIIELNVRPSSSRSSFRHKLLLRIMDLPTLDEEDCRELPEIFASSDLTGLALSFRAERCRNFIENSLITGLPGLTADKPEQFRVLHLL